MLLKTRAMKIFTFDIRWQRRLFICAVLIRIHSPFNQSEHLILSVRKRSPDRHIAALVLARKAPSIIASLVLSLDWHPLRTIWSEPWFVTEDCRALKVRPSLHTSACPVHSRFGTDWVEHPCSRRLLPIYRWVNRECELIIHVVHCRMQHQQFRDFNWLTILHVTVGNPDKNTQPS